MFPLGEKRDNTGKMNDTGGGNAEEDKGSVKEFILPGYNDGVCNGEVDGINEGDLTGDLGTLPLPPLNGGVVEPVEDQEGESESKGGGHGQVRKERRLKHQSQGHQQGGRESIHRVWMMTMARKRRVILQIKTQRRPRGKRRC